MSEMRSLPVIDLLIFLEEVNMDINKTHLVLFPNLHFFSSQNRFGCWSETEDIDVPRLKMA